jgi:hypothetical protein
MWQSKREISRECSDIIGASFDISMLFNTVHTQAFVSFKKYMPHPLPYFKVNIYPFPLPHFASKEEDGAYIF